jgi:hypothetical protein
MNEQHGIVFEGGPGDTIETAVIIRGAPSHLVGILAEYRYFAQRFRKASCQVVGQTLHHHSGRYYDRMEVKLNDGTGHIIFFDITDFFMPE